MRALNDELGALELEISASAGSIAGAAAPSPRSATRRPTGKWTFWRIRTAT